MSKSKSNGSKARKARHPLHRHVKRLARKIGGAIEASKPGKVAAFEGSVPEGASLYVEINAGKGYVAGSGDPSGEGSPTEHVAYCGPWVDAQQGQQGIAGLQALAAYQRDGGNPFFEGSEGWTYRLVTSKGPLSLINASPDDVLMYADMLSDMGSDVVEVGEDSDTDDDFPANPLEALVRGEEDMEDEDEDAALSSRP